MHTVVVKHWWHVSRLISSSHHHLATATASRGWCVAAGAMGYMALRTYATAELLLRGLWEMLSVVKGSVGSVGHDRAGRLPVLILMVTWIAARVYITVPLGRQYNSVACNKCP